MNLTRTHATRPDHLDIALPPTWRRRADPAHDVVVAARATALPDSGIRPELVLRCTPVDDDELTTWRRGALAELAGLLHDFALEDEDDYAFLGHEVAYRRFAHRVGTTDVLCDQWAWLNERYGVTLTCSVARADYLDYCDLFEEVAASVDLTTRAA